MKNIGVTGTRDGMSLKQKETLLEILEHIIHKHPSIKESHHGQCVGVDVEFAIIVKEDFNLKVVSHPPLKTELIGSCFNHEVKEPKSYFERNRDIVNSSDLMFVIPRENTPQKNKGGTWYTYHYSLKNKKPTILIEPSGSLKMFNYSLQVL